jgi:hypothetical protein
MKTKCLLCTSSTETGQGFYDHLEDVHMMPIRRMRFGDDGRPREETHQECMERFKFNHEEYGTELCWCPDCIGGETLTKVNEVCSEHRQIYIKEKHR